jgi:hypothetical protein
MPLPKRLPRAAIVLSAESHMASLIPSLEDSEMIGWWKVRRTSGCDKPFTANSVRLDYFFQQHSTVSFSVVQRRVGALSFARKARISDEFGSG